MNNYCIITIVDSIEPTSMPVNEFVIYRANHTYPIRQVLIVCTGERFQGVTIPDNVSVHFVGHNYRLMRETVKGLLSDCKKRGESYVFHLHSQTSALVFFIGTMFMGIRSNVLFTIHSLYSQRSLKYRITSAICTLLANYANGVSQSVYKDYKPFIKRVKGNRFSYIENAVDFERLYQAIESLPKHSEVFDMKKLICVDRIMPLKNQEFLIKLIKQLPDSTLLLVGREDSDGKIKKIAESEGVSNRVVFTGLLPREDVYRQLNSCGIYVTASKIESFHIGVIEAMAVGLIPIVSEIPAHCEIAENAKTFRPLPFNVALWAKSIRYYQQMADGELNTLSEEIKESAIKNFSIEKMHQDYMNIYQKLV